jgi:hypothetical protein
MKIYLTVTASLLAGATLMLATVPAVAANVDVNIGVPGVYVQPQPVYVQPRPVYIQPQYESDWRDRHVRAVEWRDNPRNHGQVVSANAHARNDIRKSKHKKHKHHGNH